MIMFDFYNFPINPIFVIFMCFSVEIVVFLAVHLVWLVVVLCGDDDKPLARLSTKSLLNLASKNNLGPMVKHG